MVFYEVDDPNFSINRTTVSFHLKHSYFVLLILLVLLLFLLLVLYTDIRFCQRGDILERPQQAEYRLINTSVLCTLHVLLENANGRFILFIF